MANNLTDYSKKKLLDHINGVASFTMPATVYVALFSADPTKAGILTNELTGNGYARKSFTMPAVTSGQASVASNADVVFNTATGTWATATHVGIMDASTAGNMLWFGPLGTAKTVTANDVFRVLSGNLTTGLN